MLIKAKPRFFEQIQLLHVLAAKLNKLVWLHITNKSETLTRKQKKINPIFKVCDLSKD